MTRAAATTARGFVALPCATAAAFRLAGNVEERIVCIVADSDKLENRGRDKQRGGFSFFFSIKKSLKCKSSFFSLSLYVTDTKQSVFFFF